jgi:chorismate synthase
MIGCHLGRNFQVTVAGGSYQDGLTVIIEDVPSGMLLPGAEHLRDIVLLSGRPRDKQGNASGSNH